MNKARPPKPWEATKRSVPLWGGSFPQVSIQDSRRGKGHPRREPVAPSSMTFDDAMNKSLEEDYRSKIWTASSDSSFPVPQVPVSPVARPPASQLSVRYFGVSPDGSGIGVTRHSSPLRHPVAIVAAVNRALDNAQQSHGTVYSLDPRYVRAEPLSPTATHAMFNASLDSMGESFEALLVPATTPGRQPTPHAFARLLASSHAPTCHETSQPPASYLVDPAHLATTAPPAAWSLQPPEPRPSSSHLLQLPAVASIDPDLASRASCDASDKDTLDDRPVDMDPASPETVGADIVLPVHRQDVITPPSAFSLYPQDTAPPGPSRVHDMQLSHAGDMSPLRSLDLR